MEEANEKLIEAMRIINHLKAEYDNALEKLSELSREIEKILKTTKKSL